MSLKALQLPCNLLAPDGAQRLADELQWLPRLTLLNLRHNAIGADGAVALAAQH